MEAGTGVLGMGGAPSRRMGKRTVVVVLTTTMLVGGTYLWQVHDRQVALDRAVSSGDAARSQASALQDQVAGLQGQIETLQHNAEGLTARFELVSGSKQHLADRLDVSDQRLRRAEARMTALLGSPPADGRYFGAVVLVGANQTPPRLVIDLEQWLTGAAAQQAAIEYGYAYTEGEYFIENDSPTWHTVEIAPTATVSIVDPMSQVPLLHVGTGVVGQGHISLERLADTMGRGHHYNPFWITVSNGRITTIEEEYTP